MPRRTVAAPVELRGVGLHLGHECILRLLPAPSGQGIVFRRTDLPGQPTIPARIAVAVPSDRRTQLGSGEAALHTVEHVLAAVAGAELDDVTIEMNAPEPPVLDGSALPFLRAIEQAGIAAQAGSPEYLRITRPLTVTMGESEYHVTPARSLQLDVVIEFPHPMIGRQGLHVDVNRESFSSELAGARTFGFMREVDALRAQGLIQGASHENTVVLDDHQVVSGPLRWPNEFVRHKALDCVGDLALAGARIQASITALKPSHRGTLALVKELTAVGQKEKYVLGIEDIMKVLPHRYPFLLVDRILEIDAKKRIVGMKNVTINEPFFQGHFPGHAIMPGVLIIEAMAQVGGMLLMGSVENPENQVVYFMSLDNVKFRRPVRPGDQIRFELEMTQVRGRICRMRGVALVDGEVVAEADMAAMVRDR